MKIPHSTNGERGPENVTKPWGPAPPACARASEKWLPISGDIRDTHYFALRSIRRKPDAFEQVKRNLTELHYFT